MCEEVVRYRLGALDSQGRIFANIRVSGDIDLRNAAIADRLGSPFENPHWFADNKGVILSEEDYIRSLIACQRPRLLSAD